MTNIKYDFQQIASSMPKGASFTSIRDELISQMSERMARSYDRRILGLIEKRLGGAVELESMRGRLARVAARGAGYETLLLDGVPFARVHELSFATEGSMMAIEQVIEEMSP